MLTKIAALTTNVGMGASQAQIISGWYASMLSVTRYELTDDSVQIVFMMASLVPSFALDRMGRRRTLIAGLIGIGFSMMMISILLSFEGNTKTASASVAFFFLVSLHRREYDYFFQC